MCNTYLLTENIRVVELDNRRFSRSLNLNTFRTLKLKNVPTEFPACFIPNPRYIVFIPYITSAALISYIISKFLFKTNTRLLYNTFPSAYLSIRLLIMPQ